MSDYLITGKKGNGKGLFAIHVILKALRQGKRVATNVDVFLHNQNPFSKSVIIRLPDFVTSDDLNALGRGQKGVVEDDNGVVVIDEASRVAGARSWSDKDRESLLEWLIHSRKHGWDSYMISQGAAQLDKMIRNTQLEYSVSITRSDKWRFPIIGVLGKLRPSGEPFRLPRMNIATIRHGFHQGAMVCDRIFYRGTQYYNLYHTQQIFLDRDHPDAVMLHSVLPPWLTHGRYLPQRPKSVRELIRKWAGEFFTGELNRSRVALKPKHALVKRIMKLPEHRRVEFFRRFQACGAI